MVADRVMWIAVVIIILGFFPSVVAAGGHPPYVTQMKAFGIKPRPVFLVGTEMVRSGD
jgi:hypothetical protein